MGITPKACMDIPPRWEFNEKRRIRVEHRHASGVSHHSPLFIESQVLVVQSEQTLYPTGESMTLHDLCLQVPPVILGGKSALKRTLVGIVDDPAFKFAGLVFQFGVESEAVLIEPLHIRRIGKLVVVKFGTEFFVSPKNIQGECGSEPVA